MSIKIGVEQYMLRDYMNSEDQARFILRKMKEIGYRYLELCSFLIEPNEMAKSSGMEIDGTLDWPTYLSEEGIKACSIHEIVEDTVRDTDQIVARAKKFGTDTIVVTGSFATDFESLESVKKLIRNLNTVGRRLKEAGFNFLYHNHNAELVKISGSSDISLDVIYKGIDPEYVGIQMDLFWLLNGGVCPSEWCEKLGGRVKSLHLNDAGPSEAEGPVIRRLIRGLVGKELGTGNIDFKSIIKNACANGCESLILETHDNWVNNDPVESMRVSYNYLNNLGL